jgi:hypothetical protein
MKTATLCVIMALELTVWAHADDNPSLNAVEAAGKDYLNKIDKAEKDYLSEIRLALRKTTVIEVFLIDFPGKGHPDPFDAEDDRRFVASNSGWSFEILKSARIDKAKEVTAFLNATVPDKSGSIIMGSAFPTIGFRCLAGDIELFAATVDLRSHLTKIIFPNGQWAPMGIDIESTKAILKDIGIR